MLQNTKAWRVPSGSVKTGTTQKQNLSLAVSQAERAPECQERAWKGGGAEQQKNAFLKGQRSAPAALQREAGSCEGCTWGRDALDSFSGQQGAAVPPHSPPSCSLGSGSVPKKSKI